MYYTYQVIEAIVICHECIQLVGLTVEHLTSMCCGPQHVDVGFFVSQSVSLQRRMRPQDQCTNSWLRRLDRAAGLRMAKRVAGVAMAPRPTPSL